MNRLKAKFVDFTSMTSATADTLFAWFNVMAIVGGVLAAIGTGGIFLTGGVREHYADLKQNELQKQTAEAQRGAAEANERAAKLNKDSESLKVELEKERVERLRLEERVAPRRVTQQMRKQLGEMLVPEPQTALYFKVGLNDSEGSRFINEFANACVAAGWPQDRMGGATVAGAAFPPGVTIGVNAAEAVVPNIRPIAEILAKILTDAGLAADQAMAIDEDAPMGTVTVACGLKPDPKIA